MSNLTIFLIIYFSGYVVSYLIWFLNFRKKYTIGKRIAGLSVSLFSWLGVLASVTIAVSDYHDNNKNRPAKW